MLIGYDNGMGNNKIYFKNGKKEVFIDFPSRVKKLDNESTETIFINGVPYSFSEGRLAVENGHNTKDDEMHQLLLYKGMYEIYKRTGETEFDIATNCSLDSYKDDKGLSVKEKMTENKTIKIKEKFKDEVELKINNLEVLPEALVGGLICKLKLREEDVIVIDLGTKNLTIIQIINGTPMYETSFSPTDGMQKIYEAISDRTKVHEKGLSSAISIQMYLEKTANGTYEIIPKIDDIILKYLMETVFTEMDKKLRDLNMSIFTKLVFLGGGASYLKRFLEAKFTNREMIFVENGYYANAIGLYKKGERLFGYFTPDKKKAGVK